MNSSFVPIPHDSDFPLENIPFGVYSLRGSNKRRPATIVGDTVVDLYELAAAKLFDGPELCAKALDVFSQSNLNAFMELGRPAWREARVWLQKLLSGTDDRLANDKRLQGMALVDVAKTLNYLPMVIGDYTDFYASKEHATNVGTMFRGKDNALMPNWVHIPVGYHGRASSVVVSGTQLIRPSGLIQPDRSQPPVYGASRKLDFELEVAFVVGKGNPLGQPIKIENASDHIFGLVLMNDWSARDIQAFEYVPLGPFLGKNFGTTISPWIVTLDALEPFLTELPTQDPTPSEYLRSGSTKEAYDVELSVNLQPHNVEKGATICVSNLKYMYWSIKQQLAHHTVNGCNMNAGDLCGSGTISGKEPHQYGSLLELSWNGTAPLELEGDVKRSFLEDGDQLTITGKCSNGHLRLGFGKCTGSILPAK